MEDRRNMRMSPRYESDPDICSISWCTSKARVNWTVCEEHWEDWSKYAGPRWSKRVEAMGPVVMWPGWV